MTLSTTRRLAAATLALSFAISACTGATEPAAQAPAEATAADTALDATAGVAEATAGVVESTVVINVPPASGPTDPELFPEGKYAAAADIKAAVDNGADIVFVDSRTQMDYEFGHVPGAVNVPYFEAEQHYSKLPTDRWIITYCECPHAEAEQVADVLLANGFTLVRVMDEGLAGWRELGGATEGGAPPAEG